MNYTIEEIEAVASRLQSEANQSAKSLGEILAAAASICKNSEILGRACGTWDEREDYFGESILASICSDLGGALKSALSPEQLRWYFSSDDPEEE